MKTAALIVWMPLLATAVLAEPLWQSLDTNHIDQVARKLIVDRFPEVLTNRLQLLSLTRELEVAPKPLPEILRIKYRIQGTEGTNTWHGKSHLTYQGITISLDQTGQLVKRGDSGCYKATVGLGSFTLPSTFGITFTDQPLQVVLDYYVKLAGLKLINDANPNTIIPTFSLRDVTDAQGVLMIEQTLLKQGYVLEKIDDKTVRVSGGTGATSPKTTK